jgi:hypothetical protein
MIKIEHDSASTRRHVLALGAFGLLSAPLWAAKQDAPLVEVWKDPSCGCCGDWVRHLEANGFRTQVYDEGNTAKRASMGITRELGSCHTAVVAGYAIEGHVPARDIRRLLSERPAAIGLAVPGMPIGSPGMDGPAYGGRKDSYTVLLVAKNGSASVYHRY